MFRSHIAASASTLLAIIVFSQHAASQGNQPPETTKVALIIGNSDYDENGLLTLKANTPANRLYDLKNPCNDAELVASKLEQLKWDPKNIILRCNATRAQLIASIEEFAQTYMSGNKSFGFIYYAGHGMQVGDTTYVFGVDTLIDIDQSIVRYKNHPKGNLFKGGIKLKDDILSAIGDPGSGSLFLVLDACRENPIATAMVARNILTISAPVKPAEPPVFGMKFLYSTANGRLASDGAGGNSPFASQFADQMDKQPNIDHFIRHVVKRVIDATKITTLPQVPEETGTFNPPPPDACFRIC